jgi:hypothetical protein
MRTQQNLSIRFTSRSRHKQKDKSDTTADSDICYNSTVVFIRVRCWMHTHVDVFSEVMQQCKLVYSQHPIRGDLLHVKNAHS